MHTLVFSVARWHFGYWNHFGPLFSVAIYLFGYWDFSGPPVFSICVVLRLHIGPIWGLCSRSLWLWPGSFSRMPLFRTEKPENVFLLAGMKGLWITAEYAPFLGFPLMTENTMAPGSLNGLFVKSCRVTRLPFLGSRKKRGGFSLFLLLGDIWPD